MNAAELDFLRTPVWYPVLAGHTFLTSFVKLRKDALNILIAGGDFDREEEGRNPAVKRVIEDLRQLVYSLKELDFLPDVLLL